MKGNEESGQLRWHAEIGGLPPAPAVEGGTVYVTSQGLYSFDADGGTKQWCRSSPDAIFLGPEVSEETVYGIGTRMLAAYDAASGEQRWRKTWPNGTIDTSPIVGENAVFVGFSSTPTHHTDSKFPEDLWAFDKRDGHLLWKRDLSGQTSADSGGQLVIGSPVFHDGTLYVQTNRGAMYALDPSDGSEQWRHQLDDGSGAGGPTLVAERDLLIVPLDFYTEVRGKIGALVALRTDDGSERWRVNGIQTAPVSDRTTVYGGEMADVGGRSTVFALSAADGSEQWRFTKPGRLKTWSSLSAAEGTLFASFTERRGSRNNKDDDSTIYAVGTGGTEQWRFKRQCGGFSSAVLSEETVYVAGRWGDGTLYALAPET